MNQFMPVLVMFSLIAAACGPEDPTGTPSEEVMFPDLELQACYDAQEDGLYWRPFAEDIPELRCFGRDIRDLSGIEVLTGLTAINLTGNRQLGSIELLAELPNLQVLAIGECNIDNSDLSVIASITQMTDLELYGNHLGDISMLGRLTELKRLLLSGSEITGGVMSLSALSPDVFISIAGNPELPCSEIEALRLELPSANIIPSELEVGRDCNDLVSIDSQY